MLVAIVLLGTVVVGSLTALRATIIATEIDADHANGYTWLQAAADAVDAATYVGCDAAPNNTIVAAYQAAANAASRPAEWVSTSATVTVDSVDYLSRAGAGETWGPTCGLGDPESPMRSQRVRLVVVDPDGEFSADLEVIKGG